MGVIRIDLTKCKLSEDLDQDKSQWRNIIHVANSNIVEKRQYDDDD